jgi:hypothetical protein
MATDMYISFAVSGNPDVVIDVDEDVAGVVPAAIEPGEIVRKAAHSLDEAMSTIRPVIATAIAQCRTLAEVPDEVSISFGLKFSADFGAIVAKAGGEASVVINATWRRTNSGR